MKSKKVIVILPKQDFEKLRELAKKERLSVSSLVRHFIVRKLYNPLERVI